MVKGNAYGHNLKLFTTLASEMGVDSFAVYSADEAYEIHLKCQPKPNIYIMGMVEDSGLEWAIEHELEVCVFDLERLDQANRMAEKVGKKAKIHLEIETGMNRTGFATADLNKLIEKLKTLRANISVYGVCTHLAGAESSSNDERVKLQIKRFKEASDCFEKHGIRPKYRHAACSAALMNYPDTCFDMVRIGIMQYGFWSNPETYFRYRSSNKEATDPLKRLIGWKSTVMSLKSVQPGEYIGYGSSHEANRPMKIAVVPVGYAHGYNRNLSNAGKVLIHGMEARITGLVNMNAVSVDITEIPGVEKGDEVVLIGNQQNKSVTVASFGEISEQLNYELLTRLPHDIPRVLID